MVHSEEIINQIVEILRTANERELTIALEFIRSLTRKR